MADNLSDKLRLGVNIDHVATIRNARGGDHPDPIQAAHIAMRAGADSIVAHLREDRRHILDSDIERLTAQLSVPLNLEMAATDEMLDIALRHKPHAACIVPEKRQEITTEGGLNICSQIEELTEIRDKIKNAGILLSLNIQLVIYFLSFNSGWCDSFPIIKNLVTFPDSSSMFDFSISKL